jgi:hypothetical protein
MPAPSDRDLRMVRDVTANFFFWQGLRWVPLGVALIVLALASTVGARDAAWAPWVMRGTLALALWLSTTVAGRYYRRTFGAVRALPGLHTRRTAIKWLVVYPAMVGAMILDGTLELPVFLSGFAFAAGIVAYRHSTGGGRAHYLAAAGALAVIALLPLTGLVPTGRALFSPFIGLLGAIYVVGGVLDHHELVRILRPVARQEHGGAV